MSDSPRATPPSKAPTPSAYGEAVEADLSTSKRLANLTEVMRDLSAAGNQDEAIDVFFNDLRTILDRKAFLYLDTADLVEQNFRVRKLMAADGRDLTDVAIVDQGDVSQGGFVGEVCEESRPRLFADLNLRDDPVFGTALLMYRSAMAVPLYRGGKVGGWVWVLSFQPESFNEKELSGFLLRANLFGITMQKLEHAGRLAAREGAGAAEAEYVGSLQSVLLRRERPDLRGVELAVSYEPVNRPGGDYHIIYKPDREESKKSEPRFGILLADVRGGGAASAMAFAMLDALVTTLPQDGKNAAEVLAALNRFFCSRKIEGVSVPAFLGFYNTATRQLNYAAADAPRPIVRRPHFRGEIEVFALEIAETPALGLKDDAEYQSRTLKLAPDDTILFHSDGVSGARNREGEMLGTSRIQTTLKISSGGPQDVIDRIQRIVREHEHNQEQHDDQTLIALRIHY